MGAPLAGSEVRAYVLTGGKLKLKGLRPKMRSSRVQMIFPLRGTERRGLVSLETKKQKVRGRPVLGSRPVLRSAALALPRDRRSTLAVFTHRPLWSA